MDIYYYDKSIILECSEGHPLIDHCLITLRHAFQIRVTNMEIVIPIMYRYTSGMIVAIDMYHFDM